MRNHRISLQDIATLAVTKMTVSRYIRFSPKRSQRKPVNALRRLWRRLITSQPRARDAAECAKLYARRADPLVSKPLFADILAGIESVTSGHNYQTLIANYNYDRES